MLHPFYNPSGWPGVHPWGKAMALVHKSDWIEFDLTKKQTEGETTDLMQKQFASWEFLMCRNMQSVISDSVEFPQLCAPKKED